MSFKTQNWLNLAFKTGIDPDSLKITKVIPIHKKDSKLIASWPIFILWNLDKILEKLMHSTLMKFFDDKKILHLKQLGFQRNFSKSNAIISQVENIDKYLDDKQIACRVFYRSWNSIWYCWLHPIAEQIILLWYKDTVDTCFKSYLSNHTVYVSSNGFNSKHKLMTYDASQGSVLRPLLFLFIK